MRFFGIMGGDDVFAYGGDMVHGGPEVGLWQNFKVVVDSHLLVCMPNIIPSPGVLKGFLIKCSQSVLEGNGWNFLKYRKKPF